MGQPHVTYQTEALVHMCVFYITPGTSRLVSVRGTPVHMSVNFTAPSSYSFLNHCFRFSPSYTGTSFEKSTCTVLQVLLGLSIVLSLPPPTHPHSISPSLRRLFSTCLTNSFTYLKITCLYCCFLVFQFRHYLLTSHRGRRGLGVLALPSLAPPRRCALPSPLLPSTVAV